MIETGLDLLMADLYDALDETWSSWLRDQGPRASTLTGRSGRR
ncbi:hypothetical protein [Streptomyces sp. WAC 01529]|nr:hypothetical protein [Streptomyces sp. WAC 01529]